MLVGILLELTFTEAGVPVLLGGPELPARYNVIRVFVGILLELTFTQAGVPVLLGGPELQFLTWSSFVESLFA